MSLKTLGVTLGVGAGIAGAYKVGEIAYQNHLENTMPEGGDKQSIFPFMQLAAEVCEQSGLQVEFMGGPVKQSLCDPETELLSDSNEINVSSNPDSRTIRKATLYRPNHTVRDLDILVTHVDDSPALPSYKGRLEVVASEIQHCLNEEAVSRGYLRGPELSLFGYEPRYGEFRITDYATRTHCIETGNEMTHSLGASQKFEDQARWSFNVQTKEGQFVIPTTSPVRILGRTLTRSLIIRNRDRDEVFEAINNIRSKDLEDKILGEEWLKYQDLRTQLDESFKISNLLNQRKPLSFTNFLVAKVIAPIAPKVEESYIADMMQDPDSPIFKWTAKVMGANDIK